MTASSGWKKDDAIVARSVESGNLATGLLTLAELTGDFSCLDRWGHHITTAPDAPGDTFPPEVAAQIRAMLAEAIRTRNLHGEPDVELIRRIVPYAAPELRLPEDKDFYLEQIGVGTTNQLAWRKGTPDRLQDFKVVVIGAGFSGVAIARHLKRLGIPYTVYEKQNGYGGSWLKATYPGAGPDSAPNHFFSYSFAQKPDWTRYYATYEGHSEIIAYLNEVIANEGLGPDIQLQTEVVRAVWNEAREHWNIVVRNEAGREEAVTAQVVISASGLLAYSHVPDFPGLDKFAGDKVDVGSWPESVRLEGKRIALVGTGATANIIGPRLADMAKELRVFQRHPHWIARVDKYLREVPEGERWLLANVPSYARWERMRAMLSTMDRYRPMTLVDPDWRSSHGTFSAQNEAFRAELIGYINEVLGEKRPELVPKMIPDYPPFSRRIIRDSGWYEMLTRDNVHFHEAARIGFDEESIIDDEGVRHRIDGVVFATGYKVQKMLATFEAVGRGGVSMRDVWGDADPRAYLGLTVPRFPNFYIMFGPNTGMAGGGSTIATAEVWAHYIAEAIVHTIEEDLASVEVKQDVHDQYNQLLDQNLLKMGWASGAYKNWYQNENGRVTTHMPWTNYGYWQLARHFKAADYIGIPMTTRALQPG